MPIAIAVRTFAGLHYEVEQGLPCRVSTVKKSVEKLAGTPWYRQLLFLVDAESESENNATAFLRSYPAFSLNIRLCLSPYGGVCRLS